MNYNRFREHLGAIAVRVNSGYNSGNYKFTRGELGLLTKASSKELQELLPMAIQDNLLQQVTSGADESGEFFRFVDIVGFSETYKTFKQARDSVIFGVWGVLVSCILLTILIAGWRATVSWWAESTVYAELETKERNIAAVKECASLYAEYEEASPKLKAYALDLLKEKKCPTEIPSTQPETSTSK